MVSWKSRTIRKIAKLRLAVPPFGPPIGLVATTLLVLTLVMTGCGPSKPFPMTQVTGTVTYDDGTLIPGDRIVVTFVPQTPPVDKKTYPRSGNAVVDTKTGKFDIVTTSKYGDGLIRGKHKVFVVSVDKKDRQLPVVPFPYFSGKDTPIEIDTEESPLKIEIPRPKS